jgi:hypothetical protein
MEQQVNQVINFGIGCAKAASDQYSEFAEWIKESVSNLVAQGEKSNAPASVRIRELADKAAHLFSRQETAQKTIRAA